MDAETLDMLRSSLRHVLAEDSSRPLADRLDELGWSDVVADDEATAMRTIFEIKGDSLSPADALGPYVAGVLARALGDGAIAASAVVLPVGGTGSAVLKDGVVQVDGVLLAAADPAGSIVFATADGSLMAIDGSALAVSSTHGFDESMSVLGVSGAVDLADVRLLDDGDAWSTALGLGRAMLAAELVGIGVHVVGAAVEYTGARVQYGKAIGTFQALQHRLAGAHALVVGASRLANEAVATGDPWTAMVAKSLAGHAAENACTQAQQCYGAIGFTWEHEFHRYLRRTYLLDALLGDWRSLEHQIGAALQTEGTVRRIGGI